MPLLCLSFLRSFFTNFSHKKRHFRKGNLSAFYPVQQSLRAYVWILVCVVWCDSTDLEPYQFSEWKKKHSKTNVFFICATHIHHFQSRHIPCRLTMFNLALPFVAFHFKFYIPKWHMYMNCGKWICSCSCSCRVGICGVQKQNVIHVPKDTLITTIWACFGCTFCPLECLVFCYLFCVQEVHGWMRLMQKQQNKKITTKANANLNQTFQKAKIMSNELAWLGDDATFWLRITYTHNTLTQIDMQRDMQICEARIESTEAEDRR